MSELADLRRRIQAARDSGQRPTLVLMTPASWFRLKANYVDETGTPDPTFRDVLGVDVFFIADQESYIVGEDCAKRLQASPGPLSGTGETLRGPLR